MCISHSISRTIFIYDLQTNFCIQKISLTYFPSHLYTDSVLYPSLYISEGPQITCIHIQDNEKKGSENSCHSYQNSFITTFVVSEDHKSIFLLYKNDKTVYQVDASTWNIISRYRVYGWCLCCSWKASLRSHGEYIVIRDQETAFIGGDDNECIRYPVTQTDVKLAQEYEMIRGTSKCCGLDIQASSSTLFFFGIRSHLDVIYNVDEIFCLTTNKRVLDEDCE